MCEVADFRQMLDGRRVRLCFYMTRSIALSIPTYEANAFLVGVLAFMPQWRRGGMALLQSMLLIPPLLPYLPVRTLCLSPMHFNYRNSFRINPDPRTFKSMSLSIISGRLNIGPSWDVASYGCYAAEVLVGSATRAGILSPWLPPFALQPLKTVCLSVRTGNCWRPQRSAFSVRGANIVLNQYRLRQIDGVLELLAQLRDWVRNMCGAVGRIGPAPCLLVE
mmetsp:Transcript_12496/g.27720  ORF Transcript_12496/g.27720 Transcript_12496/m.27720 type:complete len:221 (-) Transcript_12496:140-802(-)